MKVNVAGGGGSGGQQTGGTSTGSGGSEGSATTAIVQTQATPGEIPHQIQIQPQQVHNYRIYLYMQLTFLEYSL